MKSIALLLAPMLFFSTVVAQTGDTWQQKMSLGNSAMTRIGAATFSIGTKGYVTTGSIGSTYKTDLWEYDPASNAWTQKADFPGGPKYYGVGFGIGNKGYIGTGSQESNVQKNFWEYDPSTNSWSRKADFPGIGRLGAVGFSIGNKGYLGTGTSAFENVFYKDFWQYNPVTDKWIKKADFGGDGRGYAVGLTIRNKGYIGTGNYNYLNLKDFWEYDTLKNSWTRKADFGGSERQNAFGFGTNENGYIGTGKSYGSEYKDFWGYNPISDIWTQQADLSDTSRRFAIGFSINGKGYAGLGMQGEFSGNYLSDFWEYNPGSNIWIAKADFGNTSRSEGIGFSIGSKGYIGLGQSDLGTFKLDFWEYDQENNVWTQKADFGGSHRVGAVSFAIGAKGYVGTGWDGSANRRDFWEFSPATNTWTQKKDFGGVPREYGVGFSVGTKGYIGVGITDSGPDYNNDFWEYDPATDRWTRKANFKGKSRVFATGLGIGNKGYIGLGLYNSKLKRDFWEYDPALDKWTKKAHYGGKAKLFATGFSIKDKGYIGAGQINTNGYTTATKDFWEYNPAMDAWSRKNDFGGNERYSAIGFSIGNFGYMGFGNGGSFNDWWQYTLPAENPSISIMDTSGFERNSDSSLLKFVVKLNFPATVELHLKYKTFDGTATAPSDYSAETKILTFYPGDTIKLLRISINGDKILEADEYFSVRLLEADNGVILDSSATGTIKNDDFSFVSSGQSSNSYTSSIKFYPNPVKHILHYQTNVSVVISIINTDGKDLLTKAISGTGEINISALASGIYYIKNNLDSEIKKIEVLK